MVDLHSFQNSVQEIETTQRTLGREGFNTGSETLLQSSEKLEEGDLGGLPRSTEFKCPRHSLASGLRVSLGSCCCCCSRNWNAESNHCHYCPLHPRHFGLGWQEEASIHLHFMEHILCRSCNWLNPSHTWNLSCKKSFLFYILC